MKDPKIPKNPLYYSYGDLNPIEKPLFERLLDSSGNKLLESMAEAASNLFTSDTIANTGPYKAIVLRVEEMTNSDLGIADWLYSYFDGKKSTPPQIVRIKARIPELHSSLPIPSEDGNVEGPHQKIIDMHPTFVAQSDLVAIPSTGDLVWVDYGNKTNFTDPIYIRPVLEKDSVVKTLGGGSAKSSFENCTSKLPLIAPVGDSPALSNKSSVNNGLPQQVRGDLNGKEISTTKTDSQTWVNKDEGGANPENLNGSSPSSITASNSKDNLNSIKGDKVKYFDLIRRESDKLDIEFEVALAFFQVETGGRSAFCEDTGKMLIRFEPNVLLKQAKKVNLDNKIPWSSKSEWKDQGNKHCSNCRCNVVEYNHLRNAIVILGTDNEEIAYLSCSYGIPQIMGFNYKMLNMNFNSAKDMFNKFSVSEATQVIAFFAFIKYAILKQGSIHTALQKRDWRLAARIYNGPGNEENYGSKLEKYYNKFKSGELPSDRELDGTTNNNIPSKSTTSDCNIGNSLSKKYVSKISAVGPARENRVKAINYGTLPSTSTLLVEVPSVRKVQRLHAAAFISLNEMRNACLSEIGVDIRVASGWRPHRWKSKAHYESEMISKYNSVREGRKWMAYSSPHETGLAFDIGTGGLAPTRATISTQKKTPLYAWLMSNAYKYGITPYLREPWHWEVNILPSLWRGDT